MDGAPLPRARTASSIRVEPMITRRTFSLVGGIGLLAALRRGRTQPSPTLRRVGLLWLASDAASAHLRAAFTQGMQDLGWLAGKNVEYRFVFADSDFGRLDALAGDLAGQGVEVMVVSPQATRAAQRASKTVPIVMAGVANADGAGFVASLAHPGGNITGLSSQPEDVTGKLVGILHEAVPAAKRIAVLLNENSLSHAGHWAAAQKACSSLGLVPRRVVASTPAALGAAVAEIARQRSQAVVVVSDGMYFAERARLQELMHPTRLPVAYGLRDHVVAGGLLSYAFDLVANYRNAAKYVDRILKGAKPADLPVELSSRFELVVNLRTARALGLTIPSSLLARADEVIR
jgi:putative ABC transport system substrate-binding protein